MSAERSEQRIGRVATSYRAAYADPLVMHTGDTVRISHRDTEWPEFVWCASTGGKAGWVPESYLERHGAVGIARRDYAATELTVDAGEMVRVTEQIGGWCWCTNAEGRSGWVPGSHLAP